MTWVIYTTYRMSTKYALVYAKAINNRQQKKEEKVQAQQNIVRIFTNIIMLAGYVDDVRWFMVTLLLLSSRIESILWHLWGFFSSRSPIRIGWIGRLQGIAVCSSNTRNFARRELLWIHENLIGNYKFAQWRDVFFFNNIVATLWSTMKTR